MVTTICMFRVKHYYFLMFQKILEKCIEIYELDPGHFLLAPGIAWHSCL